MVDEKCNKNVVIKKELVKNVLERLEIRLKILCRKNAETSKKTLAVHTTKTRNTSLTQNIREPCEILTKTVHEETL